jgi:TetR/AcrR family fatty acid metabolism transcriptional regulator
MPATSPAPVRRVRQGPDALPKRDAILRAATDVFAERGYFNAQVADVARAAGVAAGTVYLYFRSKDDLLISIFERTMREALAEGRAAVADVRDPGQRLRRLARLHLARLGRDRNLAVVFQVELRQSTKFMERLSSTLLRDYLGLIRAAIADGQRDGTFRAELNPTATAKILFGALDEMATNWMLSKRRYSLEAEAEAVLDLFVNGARAR